MTLNRISTRKGFTLVEVLLAVGIVAMAILALVGLLGATFQQVEDVVQTNQAIGVVTRVNAALDEPRLIGGEGLNGAESMSAFECVYEAMRSATSNAPVILYCFNKEVDAENPGKYAPVPVVYRSSGDNLSQQTYNQQGGVGAAFRIEITISPLLKEQNIYLDPATYEQTTARYEGGSLPAILEYALAYLLLELKIYPHDFTDISVLRNRDIPPVLTQNIVVNR